MKYRHCRHCECCGIDGECSADEDNLPDLCPDLRTRRHRDPMDEAKERMHEQEDEE